MAGWPASPEIADATRVIGVDDAERTGIGDRHR